MDNAFKIYRNIVSKKSSLLIILILFSPIICQAQFVDHFDGDRIKGWDYFTGDGNATMNFIQKDDHARITVDATKDSHNVWWAIIKRNVAGSLDLSKLKEPDFELRVEAKVRISDAPRRLNFMINTQRTTNFHKHLMEYDIADTTNWHVISMTTKDLDALPGDSLFVQLGVTDFGLETYHVDVDYYRADIININEAGPDKGDPLPYHPSIPEVKSFTNHLTVSQDALIHTEFPDINFNNWSSRNKNGNTRTLTVNANQWAILRWDFEQYEQGEADGAGLLELTTHSISKGGNYKDVYGEDLGMEFGKIRVIEILGGDPDWDQESVTYNSLIQGKELNEVFNGQMIFDAEVVQTTGSKNYITISRPVMQRLLDGKTKGLLIRPLGAIDASFYASKNQKADAAPALHFSLTNVTSE